MTVRHHSPVVPIKWVVVGDRSRTRIFSMAESESELQEIETLICPEGGGHQNEYEINNQGFFAGRGGLPVAGDAETDFQHKTAETFAVQVIDFLEAGRNNHKFGSLIVIAPPLFLGTLRKKMPDPLKQMVVLEIDKDYTAHSEADIVSLIERTKDTPV